MSNNNQGFGRQEGVDLKDLIKSQIDNIMTLISANDKSYNQRFDNVIQATQSALAAADRAVNKAETASEKRFEGINEFRGALSDQQKTLVTRTEIDLLSKTLNEKLDIFNKEIAGLRESRALLEGKASQNSVFISYVISVVGVILGILGLILK